MKNLWLKIMAVMVMYMVFFAGENCMADQAIKTDFTLRQPDGTTFTARLRGDEYMRILTTTEGHVIGQAMNGWYYYAWYDSDGKKVLSEYKVGKGLPSEILGKSAQIPVQALSNIGKQRRAQGYSRRLSDFSATKTIPAEKHALVILAQYPNLSFRVSRADIVAMMTEDGYTGYGSTGSAQEYFNHQFKGYSNFTIDVSEIVTVSKNYEYYGANGDQGQDLHPGELIREACVLAKANSNIDFSKYDDDGDGYVDNVFVIYAGGGESSGAGENTIWPHASSLEYEVDVYEVDGVTVNRYACSCELYLGEPNGIGTFCHEYSHTLDLPDFYDTDYEQSGGTSNNLWQYTNIMAGGNHNNGGKTPPNYSALDREIVGTGNAITLTEGVHILEPVDENGTYYKMETDYPGEFYLFECRAATGWDTYIGGEGLLIYHIDKSDRDIGFIYYADGNMTAEQAWGANFLNCNPSHQCAYLKTAISDAIDVEMCFFPYRGYSMNITSFTPFSYDPFKFWSGTISSLALNDIRWTEDGKIQITVVPVTETTASVVLGTRDVFQDAAIIQWSSEGEIIPEVSKVAWGLTGKEQTEMDVESYADGKFSLTLEGLKPATAYSVDIWFDAGAGGDGKKKTVSFTTSSSRNLSYPYIYLRHVDRNEDGTFPIGSRFPLRLFNVTGADAVIWKMNGEEISVERDGYYVPEDSGEMTVEIIYPDGSVDKISKNIVLK